MYECIVFFFSLANNIFIGISSSTRRLKSLAVFRFTLLLLRHLAPVSTLLVSRCRSYIYLSPIARLTCLEVHLAKEEEKQNLTVNDVLVSESSTRQPIRWCQ